MSSVFGKASHNCVVYALHSMGPWSYALCETHNRTSIKPKIFRIFLVCLKFAYRSNLLAEAVFSRISMRVNRNVKSIVLCLTTFHTLFQNMTSYRAVPVALHFAFVKKQSLLTNVSNSNSIHCTVHMRHILLYCSFDIKRGQFLIVCLFSMEMLAYAYAYMCAYHKNVRFEFTTTCENYRRISTALPLAFI